MRMLKFLMVGFLALAMTGCTCRAKKTVDETGPGPQISDVNDQGPLTDVNYGFDSYALDATAKSILARNAEWLKANPTAKVQVEGHCDERGTNEYNMVLGSNRAKASHDYLRGLGIETSRMSTVSYGEELPLDPRHTEDAWAKNRRAHFNVNAK